MMSMNEAIKVMIQSKRRLASFMRSEGSYTFRGLLSDHDGLGLDDELFCNTNHTFSRKLP